MLELLVVDITHLVPAGETAENAPDRTFARFVRKAVIGR